MINQNLRLVDANLNRLREGIRVVEDIFRYILNDQKNSKRLKKLRHLSRTLNYNDLLLSRDIKNDVLKTSTSSEQTRINLYDIFIANFKRAQESARVLEETCKLDDISLSENFKYIRYELYDIEKSIINIKL